MGQAAPLCRVAEVRGGLALARSPAALQKVNAPDAAASLRDFPADLNGLRRRFPDRWMAFLHAHFQSPAHVAAFFSVDRKTSLDWWNGKHGVNSAPVIFAMRLIPGATAFLLEAA